MMDEPDGAVSVIWREGRGGASPSITVIKPGRLGGGLVRTAVSCPAARSASAKPLIYAPPPAKWIPGGWMKLNDAMAPH